LTPKRSSRLPRRRKPTRWRTLLASAATLLVLALLAWAAIARRLAPSSNTSRTRFDAIIVLGTPADTDGNPTPDQLARVTEAVHEYERGVAPRLILTGGAAYNRFVEARVMARAAQAEGIPESAIFVEPEAMDTIQNACYSARIMKAQGWGSAEVVSTATHLPRAGLIFSRLPLEWRAHAAPALSPGSGTEASLAELIETLKTARYLVWTRQSEQCEP
jgi:uncharacterized SAM-binding protein YcdF (DUF218 family)